MRSTPLSSEEQYGQWNEYGRDSRDGTEHYGRVRDERVNIL